MPASPEDPGGDYGATIALPGIASLAEHYDGFILDQWGVLHDGMQPYAGARDCLERMRAAGKRVVMLSNSGRRQSTNVRFMQEMGFAPALFDAFVSAGEDARSAIAHRATPFHARLGQRCFAFMRADDHELLEGLPIELVTRVREADFLLVVAIDSTRKGLADFEPDLQAARELGLPMVCANPDIFRFSASGLVDAPGVIARRYEQLGGEVFYHGKPHPAIYASCLDALAGCSRERVIAIGDSIEHDALGAARAGLPCALVAGGVHIGALGAAWGRLPSPEAWRQFMRNAPACPRYLVPAFVW